MMNIGINDLIAITIYEWLTFEEEPYETDITVGELKKAEKGDVFGTAEHNRSDKQYWSILEIVGQEDNSVTAIKRWYEYDYEKEETLLQREEDIRIELP